MRRRLVRAALGLAILIAAPDRARAADATPPAPRVASRPAASPARLPELSVYAATSLRDALEDLTPLCGRAAAARLVPNFGPSNDLARQIVAGRKADLFLSADGDWMDHVARAGLVDAASRLVFASNLLVVVGRAGGSLRVAGAADLAGPAVRRLSLADPAAVPAGRYARAWLERQGVWDRVASRVVPAIDVRAALAAVASGAAEAGIVYRTEAPLEPRAAILHVVPAAETPGIAYHAAALSGRPRLAQARAVVACLASPEAAAALEHHGFLIPGGAASGAAAPRPRL